MMPGGLDSTAPCRRAWRRQALTPLSPAKARAVTPFQDSSPDDKFEVVCDVQAQLPFKIINQASGKRWRRWTANMYFASWDRWISPNKLRLTADDYARTLVITDHAAKLAR